MSNPAFEFDHIHIISQSPHDAAHWYVQMFGAEIVADTVARGASQIFLELGGKTLIIRGQRPGEAPTAGREIQPLSIMATCVPSATNCVPKGCAFPCP
jgi:hypothetical protein